MQITVQGKQMDVGDAFRTHITQKLEEINAKYFGRAHEAQVTIAPEGGSTFKTHISLHVGKNIMVQATAIEHEPYNSFEGAIEKISKQMRRYKNRLRDHHERLDDIPASDLLQVRDYVLEPETSEEEPPTSQKEPVVIAEMMTAIQTMTVSEAVMRMDLAGQTAIMFKNAKTGGLNMVYKRSDGNIGWIDPSIQLGKSGKAAAE